MAELGFPMAASEQGSPYPINDLAMMLRYLMGTTEEDNAGVVEGYLNELEVTFAGSTINIDSGAACIGGFIREFPDDINIAVDIPDSGTTGKRVILRATWDSPDSNDIQIEQLILSSADGTSSLPTLVQSFDNIWEISLASFTINTSGTISSLTDERVYCAHTPFLESFGKGEIVAFGTVVGGTLQTGTSVGIASVSVANSTSVTYNISITFATDVSATFTMGISSRPAFNKGGSTTIQMRGQIVENNTVHILAFA